MKRVGYRILAWAAAVSVLACGVFGVSASVSCAQEIAAGEEAVAADGEEGGAAAPSLDVAAPSAILLEASTGKIILEKDADVRRSPASITKIMTLLLIFEQLENGKLRLDDEVTTSAHAKSMGGSQVFLEEGEVQTVDTLIKCIAVASGNDASVAMAERIAGSEEAFVELMNEKARTLGMNDTHFEDCCGLTNSDGHYTTARDVARMSRELVTRYPQVYEYTKIWMEDIMHTTKQGSSQFTLSSTNKLLKQYPYATGLKTGSTSKAKYCLSATASKDGIDLIAVVMAAPDYKVRVQDAQKLLEYGFSVSRLYTDENTERIPDAAVSGGRQETAALSYRSDFRYLDVEGNDVSKIEKTLVLPETVEAPVREGDIAGKAVYTLDGKEIGSVEILFAQTVERAVYRDYVRKVFSIFF